MTDRRLATVWASLLWLGALGCDDGGGSIAIDDYPAAGEDAFCEREARCGVYADKASCKTAIYVRLQVVADVHAGKIKYDGRAAAACLHSWSVTGCDELADPRCRAAFQGTVANGGGCLDDQECVSTSCNRNACGDACCMGTCEAQAALGAPCSAGVGQCVEGTFCKRDPQGGPGMCAAEVAIGQPCTTLTDECAASGYCLIDPGTGASMCAPALPGNGQPCPNGYCANETDFCALATMTCVRRIPVGGSCATAACVLWARCDATTMTCVADVPGGGACGASAACISGLQCVNGVCASAPDVPACP